MSFDNEVFSNIKERRTVRNFSDEDISISILEKLIEAGSYAPSGHNNQPWRFIIAKNREFKDQLAQYTIYGDIIKKANSLILVFMDKEHSYHREKDLMAIGAAIQNILLYAYSIGIGTTWLGEILKNAETIRELCQLSNRYELCCVIALGWIKNKNKRVQREPISKLILKVI